MAEECGEKPMIIACMFGTIRQVWEVQCHFHKYDWLDTRTLW